MSAASSPWQEQTKFLTAVVAQGSAESLLTLATVAMVPDKRANASTVSRTVILPSKDPGLKPSSSAAESLLENEKHTIPATSPTD